MAAPMDTGPERTALAWQRTGLGVLTVAFLVGHRAVTHDRPVLLVLAGGAALLGLAVLGYLGPLRYRETRDRAAADTPMTAARAVAAVTAVVVLVAAVAAVAVLTPR